MMVRFKVLVFLVICCFSEIKIAFRVLTLLDGHEEEHLACKRLSDEVLMWLSITARCK